MINIVQNYPKLVHLFKWANFCRLCKTIFLPIYTTFLTKLHIGIPGIILIPHIYYTYKSKVYKYPNTCCQIVVQPRKSPGVSINKTYTYNFETMNIPCKNMSSAAHWHQMAITYVSFAY